MAHIDFEIKIGNDVYQDSLELPDDHGLDESGIESLKTLRTHNWVAVKLSASPNLEISEPPPWPDYAMVEFIKRFRPLPLPQQQLEIQG